MKLELPDGTYEAPVVRGRPVELADGIFAIPDNRVSLVPNVGIVLGDDAALVIDTGAGPRNGAFVLDHAKRLAGRRALYLVITQLDPGHGFGAQVFKGTATIIYSAAQQERLIRHAPAYAEVFRNMGAEVAAQLEGLELVDADFVYEDYHDLDLGGVSVRLQHWGPAHTGDDQTVLVDRRVLFGGDLFETRMFPILPYVPPFDTGFDGDRWIDALDRLIAMESEIVVPGHGEVTDVDQIREVRNYLRYVREQTARARASGVPVEEVAAEIEHHALQRWRTWESPRMIRFATQAFYETARGTSFADSTG